MKALLWMAVTTGRSAKLCFSQVNFIEETKKYIDSNDPVTVFKMRFKGVPARPHQTVIVRPFYRTDGPFIDGKNALFPQMKENKTPVISAAGS